MMLYSGLRLHSNCQCSGRIEQGLQICFAQPQGSLNFDPAVLLHAVAPSRGQYEPLATMRHEYGSGSEEAIGLYESYRRQCFGREQTWRMVEWIALKGSFGSNAVGILEKTKQRLKGLQGIVGWYLRDRGSILSDRSWKHSRLPYCSKLVACQLDLFFVVVGEWAIFTHANLIGRED